MSNPELQNGTALVTGGGRGIGRAISERLAKLGFPVVITGRDQNLLEQTAKAIESAGGRCHPLACDVTDLNSVTNAARQVQREFGGLQILVNNAGIGGFSAPLHELPPEQWDAILNTNLRGVYYCIRAFAPMMIAARRGDIINISSLAGKNSLPRGAAYAASKWGLNGLSYSIAEELRAYNVRVTVVCPGSTNTDLSPHEGKNTSKMLRGEDIAHIVEMLVTQQPRSFVSEVLIRPLAKP
jgi:NAD(P)-dependent dehydrogenase (short-subunit alcohol dehydrogenase family)